MKVERRPFPYVTSQHRLTPTRARAAISGEASKYRKKQV